jgi:hypothetical protein
MYFEKFGCAGSVVVLLLAACGPGTSVDSPPDAATDASMPEDAMPDVAPVDTAPDASIDRVVVMDTPATPDAPMDAMADSGRVDVVVPDVVAPDVRVDVATLDVITTDTTAQRDASGITCGTRGGGMCLPREYCNRPITANCGRADAPGRCDFVPSVCTRELNPVCGCDGNDYSNPCAAAMAEVSVDYMGMCRRDAGTAPDATRDCRTSGCPDTSSCMAREAPAGVVYACIPRGAAC